MQARKSVEGAKDRGISLKGQARDQIAARPQRPDLAKNKKALVALVGFVLVGIGGFAVAAIAENHDNEGSTSAPANESPTFKPTPNKVTPAVVRSSPKSPWTHC